MIRKVVNPSFPCKIIVLNIKNALHGLKGFQRRNHYNSTCKYWKINEEHRNNDIFKFVVGLVDGYAETAYEIINWFPTKEKQYVGRYEFKGLENIKTKEFIGSNFRKQRSLCMGHWQWGGYLVVEFNGKGKFKILKGQTDSQWTDC
ncbi:MAG: hypothetical protein FWD40_11635 [Treponema sp.]|nr:hypothetical protein [Treponema sp.]